MFKSMFIKEWKEKSGLFIFALAGLAFFALAFSGYSKDKGTLDLLTSTVFLVFLPVFSVLLGASGFFCEFQDGAWAYLFSRPVKKWQIWITKYLSLLTVLFAVILLFALLARLHPALESARETFSFPLVGEAMSYGILVYLVPWLLFTTAFSFSILSEKVYIVAFLAALAWIVLQIAVTRAVFPLLDREMASSAFSLISLMSLLIPLSLALASLLTLGRADFSQPRRRVWTFTKLAALFVLGSVGVVTLLGLGAGWLRRERYIYNLEARNNAFYFATEKGFFKFDQAEGKTEKLARHPSMWGQMSMGGDKVAFVTYHYGGRWRGFADLRIMNIDGSEERSLVGTENQSSPLYGGFIYPLRVSPRGDRVAFVARYVPKSTPQDLWLVNSDGTGLKGYDLGIPGSEYYLLIGFGPAERSLFLLCTAKIKPGNKDERVGAGLLLVHLDSGKVELLADRIRKPYAASMSSEAMPSGTGPIAYINYDEASSREILTIIDPETLEKLPVYPEDSVTGFRWNKAGDKLAFLTTGSRLGIYSLAENRVVKMAELKGYDLRWPSQALEWTSDDRLILRRLEGKTSFMCILDTNFTEQKAVRVPFSSFYASRIWSAGKYAIVEDSERHQLWGVDLTTEKWIRVY
jgi:ABC-type transport system involved in multi-copper enzyme maturation permease subunit